MALESGETLYFEKGMAIERERDTETRRQRERYTDRETDGEKERKRERGAATEAKMKCLTYSCLDMIVHMALEIMKLSCLPSQRISMFNWHGAVLGA